jgi:hypothetical protein
MSTIRPGLPSVQFPPQPAALPPVRAARSDFFRAALEAVQAGGPEPVARNAAPSSASADQEERSPRPGALLDIRV